MTARQYVPVGIWLVVLLGCCVIISLTHYSADLSAFLPRSPNPSQEALVEQLRDGAVSRVILLGVENAPETTLTALSRDLANRLRSKSAFISVNNGEDATLAEDQAFLWNNRYLLSSAMTSERFSEKSIRGALNSDLDLLNSGGGPLVKFSISADPTSEMLHVLDDVLPTERPIREGAWMSRDGKTALLILQTAAPMSDLAAQQAGLTLIADSFSAARMQIPGASSARLIMTGPSVFSVATRNRIKGDAVRFSMIATIAIITLLFVVYRSVRVLVFGLLPVISGVLAGITAVSMTFGSVHGVTIGFGATLIGEAVDYPVYLFTQTVTRTGLQCTLQRIWPTLRLGVLTSVFGFATMLFSNFEGIAQLGVFSIAGLFTAVSVTRFILPVLLPGPLEMRRPAEAVRVVRQIFRFAPRLRPILYAGIAVAGVVIALHRGNIWDDQLVSLSPVPIADKIADQNLRNELNAPDAGYLLIVTGDSEEIALQRSEEVAAELRRLMPQRVLAGFEDAAVLLPSRATQVRRQKAIPANEELTARLDRIVSTMPFQPNAFAPFLRDAESTRIRTPIGRHSLDNTSFGALVDSLLVQRGKTWQALILLRGVTSPARMAAAIARMNLPGVLFLDIKRDSDALYGTYRRQATLLSVGGAFAIVLLLAISLGKPAWVARAVFPLIASVIITTAILIISGTALTIFHLIGLLLAVAIGSNYSLFFVRSQGFDEPHELMVISLALANLCTVIGFGVLSLSAIPVLHGIGVTVAIGAALSLAFAAILSNGVSGNAVTARQRDHGVKSWNVFC